MRAALMRLDISCDLAAPGRLLHRASYLRWGGTPVATTNHKRTSCRRQAQAPVGQPVDKGPRVDTSPASLWSPIDEFWCRDLTCSPRQAPHRAPLPASRGGSLARWQAMKKLVGSPTTSSLNRPFRPPVGRLGW